MLGFICVPRCDFFTFSHDENDISTPQWELGTCSPVLLVNFALPVFFIQSSKNLICVFFFFSPVNNLNSLCALGWQLWLRFVEDECTRTISQGVPERSLWFRGPIAESVPSHTRGSRASHTLRATTGKKKEQSSLALLSWCSLLCLHLF